MANANLKPRRACREKSESISLYWSSFQPGQPVLFGLITGKAKSRLGRIATTPLLAGKWRRKRYGSAGHLRAVDTVRVCLKTRGPLVRSLIDVCSVATGPAQGP
jgi:hypothetical protein